MTLEQQVISLSLAKRLKELGVKQGSIYYWRGVSNNTAIEPENWFYSWRIVRSDETVPEHSNNARLRIYPAFTVAELGELLPQKLEKMVSPVYFLSWQNGERDLWNVAYTEPSHKVIFQEFATTEAEARGLLLAYLLENKLI